VRVPNLVGRNLVSELCGSTQDFLPPGLEVVLSSVLNELFEFPSDMVRLTVKFGLIFQHLLRVLDV
jgi:hypothetical protein